MYGGVGADVWRGPPGRGGVAAVTVRRSGAPDDGRVEHVGELLLGVADVLVDVPGHRLGGRLGVAGGDRLEDAQMGLVHRGAPELGVVDAYGDRKSTRLNSSHVKISYAVFCLKKKRLQL